MSAHGNKEPWLEEWWMVLVIGFGLVLTLFFALYAPTVSTPEHAMQSQSQVRTDGTRDAPRERGE